MRLKDYDTRDGKRVWLSADELALFLDAVPDDHEEMQAAMLLAGRCGLRRQEIVDVCPAHIVGTDTGQVVRVWEGKGDKYREVPAPPDLTNLVIGLGREPDAPLVSVDDSTIYDWVAKVRAECRAETRDEGWQFLGPHDLRRSWATQILEQGVLPSVVMEFGGWQDWVTFRDHYLAEFSPEALRRERGKVPWLAEGRVQQETRDANPGYSVVDTRARSGYR